MKLVRRFTAEKQREGTRNIGWILIALSGVAILVSLSGCANLRPVVNENGGGGVAITTQQGSWITPVLLVGGVSYALVELFDSLKDRPNNYSGTYINNTGDGTVNVDSSNDNSSGESDGKRIRGAAVRGGKGR